MAPTLKLIALLAAVGFIVGPVNKEDPEDFAGSTAFFVTRGADSFTTLIASVNKGDGEVHCWPADENISAAQMESDNHEMVLYLLRDLKFLKVWNEVYEICTGRPIS